MQFKRMLAIGLALAGLAGCAGSFTTSADLADVTPRATPIASGTYLLAAGSAEGLVFELIDNDRYVVTQQPQQADRAPIKLSVFGPLDGFYVAQIGPAAQPAGVAATFGNFIFRTKDDGALAIVNDQSVRAALGGALLDALGSPDSASRSASILTDNAALNWAILKHAIARDSAAFTYGGDLIRAP